MRLFISLSSLLTLLIVPYASETYVQINGFHLLYSLAMLGFVTAFEGSYPVRKSLNMIVDIGALSLVIYSQTLFMAALYPLYLVIILGYGMRYGTIYLYGSLALSVLFFGGATLLNPHWNAHTELSASLTSGLVLLTLFFISQIKKSHSAHNKLYSQIENKTKLLQNRLYFDQLTDLKNRKALIEDLENCPFISLALIDIDKFGHFNDLYGMATGNLILVEVVKELRMFSITHGFEAYRTYGDGFILRATGELDSNETDTLLSSLTSFSISLEGIDGSIDITCTIVRVDDAKNPLEKADRALRFARQKSRNYVAYDESMNNQEKIKDILYWKKEIREAISEDRIVAVFQPIVDASQNVLKYESLMRLSQEKEGKTVLIAPYLFLEIAQQTNQYEQLTLIMIDKCFKAAKTIEGDFTINLTFSDIHDGKIAPYLKQKLQENNMGSRLILEIIESENITDFTVVKNFIANFKKLGVRFAIDDFGSGFLNYEHILTIMPDYLKIDGSLIRNIDTDDKLYKLSQSIVFLTKNLGIKTIAEFVHSKQVFDVAKKLQIDEFQGYYFSPPMRWEQIVEEKYACLPETI